MTFGAFQADILRVLAHRVTGAESLIHENANKMASGVWAAE